MGGGATGRLRRRRRPSTPAASADSAKLDAQPSAPTDGEKRGEPQLQEEDGGGGLRRLRARGRACVHAKRTKRGTGAEPLMNGKGQACYRAQNRAKRRLTITEVRCKNAVPRSLQKVRFCQSSRRWNHGFVKHSGHHVG